MITNVDILGVPYRVEMNASINDVDGRNLDGQISYNSALIELVRNMPPEVERRTLMHEILHAVFAHTGHSDYRHDEDLIEAVANGVVYVLQHNPQLVAYLCAIEPEKRPVILSQNGHEA